MMIRIVLTPARAVFLAGVLASTMEPARASELPPNFQESTVFSGLDQPTAVRFAKDGRVFVSP